MKKGVVIMMLFFSIIGSAQDIYKPNNTKVTSYISEVYGSLDASSQLYKNLVDLLSNRVEFIKAPKIKKAKDFDNTANYPLLNKYNSSLSRDTTLKPNSFNVLKYNLNFYPNHKTVYRFEETDWIIKVYPLNTKK